MTAWQHPLNPNSYDASDPFWRSPGAIRHHLGSDYMVATGTPIGAATDGYVVASRWSSVLGYMVGQQVEGGDKFIAYDHMSSLSPQPLGALVRRGEVIGYSGNTGSASQGPHLHISIGYSYGSLFGEEPLIDPYAYIASAIAARVTTTQQEEATMYVRLQSSPSVVYALYSQDGVMRCRLATPTEASIANYGGRVVEMMSPDVVVSLKAEGQFGKPTTAPGSVPTIDYTKLAEAIRASGALDLVIAGTARPVGIKAS